MIEVNGLKEEDLIGKVALVTADTSNDVYFELNGETCDSTGLFNWLKIWKGRHYSYDEMGKDCSPLEKYLAVILSGHPGFQNEILSILNKLKGKVITMWLPEGDARLYDRYGIGSFSPKIYESWNLSDVLMIYEEDKVGYYSGLTDTPVKFVHVPIDERMERGEFRVLRKDKLDYILVYGDNNPNCPVTVFGCVKKLNKDIIGVLIGNERVEQIEKLFEVRVRHSFGKLGQYPFLRLLGKSQVHIYPTRWVGTAREPISCASVGTPCIGSDKSHTMKRLWPDLMCDVYDIDMMVELANRLYKESDFYEYVCDKAWENIVFYNMENTKRRFMEAFLIGKGRK